MKNFKINTNQEPLSEVDIAAKGNFNQLLKTYNAMKTPFFKTPKFWFGGSALLVATVAVVMFAKMAGSDTVDGAEPNFINPPVTQADIKTDDYIISAEQDSVIKYPSGSVIRIPAHAFLDDKNAPVKGNVKLHYREFKKTNEIFLSGIPMTYDSSGQQFHFESAGMMELTASKDGKALHANPKAPIVVNMVSANKEDRFNTYYLDTAERKWKYLAQRNYNAPPRYGDTSEQPQEIAFTPANTPAVIAKNEAAKKVSAIENAIAQIQKQRPVEPRKVDESKERFSIKVDRKEFPEIAIYNNLKFQVTDKSYNPEKAKVLWENVEMKRISGGIDYEITFSNTKEQYKVVATPVFAAKDYGDARKMYDEKYAEYQSLLGKRKADEVRLKADLEARAQAVEAQIEKEMAEQLARRKEIEARMDQKDLVFRTFTVSNFGIWNSDCPASLPQGASVNAQLIDKNTGKEIKYQYCYLVEKGRNAMFTYYPGATKDLHYNPAKENMIWVVTSDFKVAVIKSDEFKATANKSNNMKFELTVIDKKLKSTEEAKAYLEI